MIDAIDEFEDLPPAVCESLAQLPETLSLCCLTPMELLQDAWSYDADSVNLCDDAARDLTTDEHVWLTDGECAILTPRDGVARTFLLMDSAAQKANQCMVRVWQIILNDMRLCHRRIAVVRGLHLPESGCSAIYWIDPYTWRPMRQLRVDCHSGTPLEHALLGLRVSDAHAGTDTASQLMQAHQEIPHDIRDRSRISTDPIWTGLMYLPFTPPRANTKP